MAVRLSSLIVSNPLYIERWPSSSQGDVRFEPITALVAEEKGLADIRYISENARGFLEMRVIGIEHGYDQGFAVREIMQSARLSRCGHRERLRWW